MLIDGFRPRRRPPPEWAERCNILDLLSLEGEYISFIVDVENEIATLEHIQACETCRTSITEKTGNMQTPAENQWRRLLTTGDDKEPDGLIDERIRVRVEKLRGIRVDAELELTDLRERLREHH